MTINRRNPKSSIPRSQEVFTIFEKYSQFIYLFDIGTRPMCRRASISPLMEESRPI